MKKPPMKGKYTKSSDSKMDSYLTRKLDKEEKEEFEKKDTAHGKKKKPKTLQEDVKIDRKIIKGIKAKEKKHEAKEGKKGEKAEDKREKKEKKK
jgi:hypothetical protein